MAKLVNHLYVGKGEWQGDLRKKEERNVGVLWARHDDMRKDEQQKAATAKEPREIMKQVCICGVRRCMLQLWRMR